jgi:hypothetical protein
MKLYSDKRRGMGPIPSEPESYLRREQVNGLAVLRKFGWRIVCIRRPTKSLTTTILINKETKKLGILGRDGILRLTDNIKIRNRGKQEAANDHRKVTFLKFRRTPK